MQSSTLRDFKRQSFADYLHREDLDDNWLAGGFAIGGVSIAGTEIGARVRSSLPLTWKTERSA